MENNDLIRTSQDDLFEDAAIIDFLIKDYQKKLNRTEFEFLLRKVFGESEAFKKNIHDINDEQSLLSCIGKKREIFTSLREIVGIVGSIVVSTHWQSPEIGSFKGKIKATINDYSRDQHILGNAFEEKYRNELVPIPNIIPAFAYATSSGMAAMTTAALFILGETKEDSVIFLGKSCYFETKQLIHKMFGERVIEVDASDTHVLSETIRVYKPSAIFIDILGNEPNMTVIDSYVVIDCIKRVSKAHVYVVIDISARTSLSLLVSSFIMPKNVSIIGVESLNKLFQFGLDRVTAGVVWGTGFKAMKLYDYRDHGGTICPDSTIATLPTPNKKMASLYMKRIRRNNEALGKSGPYVIHAWNRRYILHVMKIAKRSSIPLVHGTSFGLQTTRVYAVAMHTLYEKPFIRISAGSETVWEIERLKKILVHS